jgi:glucose uptake protein GlcU
MTEDGRSGALQMLITVAALVALLLGGVYWQSYQAQANELAELDAGLLSRTSCRSMPISTGLRFIAKTFIALIVWL